MKNMVLLLCILFLCSWAEADAQGFHLQPTPQKYVGSEDSVFIPARSVSYTHLTLPTT